MLTRRRSFLPLPLLETDQSDKGNNEHKSDEKTDEVKFDDRQQAKVNDLIAAERKRTEEATATRLKQESDESKRKADADAQRKRDEEAGKFDAVKQSLEGERDTAKASLEAATAELETLRAHVNADIDTALKDESFKPFLRFDPGKDAPIADRLKWLAEARKGIADLPTSPISPGNGPNPPAAGNTRPDVKGALARRQYIN